MQAASCNRSWSEGPCREVLSVDKKSLQKIAPGVPHGSKHGPDDDDDDDDDDGDGDDDNDDDGGGDDDDDEDDDDCFQSTCPFG